MARFSLEEGRKEIALLLEAGEKEFDNGNPLVALSILFEAQGALSEILQSEMEKVEGRLRPWPRLDAAPICARSISAQNYCIKLDGMTERSIRQGEEPTLADCARWRDQ